MSALGTTIRRHRTKEGLRLKDVAEKGHVSLQMVGLVEKGERMFSHETAKHIAKQLNDSRVYYAAAEDVTNGFVIGVLEGITNRAEAAIFAMTEVDELLTLLGEKKRELLGCPSRMSKEKAIELAVEAGEAEVASRQLKVSVIEAYGLDPLMVAHKIRTRLRQRGLTEKPSCGEAERLR